MRDDQEDVPDERVCCEQDARKPGGPMIFLEATDLTTDVSVVLRDEILGGLGSERAGHGILIDLRNNVAGDQH